MSNPGNLAKRIREKLGILNVHGLLVAFGEDRKDVAVCYHPASAGFVHAAKTRIYSPSFKTNPDAAWYDRGCKVFVGKRSDSFEPAIAWAAKEYGIDGWASCLLERATVVPAYVMEKAKAALKGAKNA